MDRSDPLAELITDYYELNGSAVEELLDSREGDEDDDNDDDDNDDDDNDEAGPSAPGPGPRSEPSPLEFMRHVRRNTPFVARGAASSWKAVRTWSAAFLRSELASHTVNVAVTPRGNADAPTPSPDGKLIFAKPWEEDEPFLEFLDYIIQQEKGELDEAAEVRYAQTQNDNLRQEYAMLYGHVQKDIPFARIALQRPPEAVNLWIGNTRSITALHRDNYENIYVQILGQKHFVLFPPLCQPCMNEQLLAPYTYKRSRNGSLDLTPDAAPADEAVPFAIWDPDKPEENATKYTALASPMRVTLNPGDMLYLPAMWYHKVSQSCLDDGICVAVNYWYDMDFDGPLYPFSTFVRSVYRTQSLS